jgi:hypothetical protein
VKRGNNRQKRNRRILLLAGLLVMAGQLGAGLLLDQNVLKVRFISANIAINGVTGLPCRPDILFMGSSRFGAGINVTKIHELMSASFAEEVPTMYNAWVAGADPYSIHFLVQHLADRGIIPPIVVIEVSPETIMLGGPFLNGQISRLITWKDLPIAAPDVIATRQHSRLLSSRLIPLFLFRQELLTWLFDSQPPYLALQTVAKQQPSPAVINTNRATPPPPANPGVSTPAPVVTNASTATPPPPDNPTVSSEKRERQIQATSLLVTKWLRGYRIGGLNPHHLQTLLGFLRAHNVAVILVGVPVSQAHYDCYTADINQKFLDYMHRLSGTYGCRFVDYRNRVPDDLFHDSHHLTINGGLFFSRMLQEEVLSEAWRQSSKVSQHARHPLPPNS